MKKYSEMNFLRISSQHKPNGKKCNALRIRCATAVSWTGLSTRNCITQYSKREKSQSAENADSDLLSAGKKWQCMKKWD